MPLLQIGAHAAPPFASVSWPCPYLLLRAWKAAVIERPLYRAPPGLRGDSRASSGHHFI